MPELPEVETLCRGLGPRLRDRRIVGFDLRLPKLFRPEDGLGCQSLIGRRVEGIWRRAKLLGWQLDAGLALLCHLKLTGQLVHVRPDGDTFAGGHPVPAFGAPLPHKATHAIFEFDDASRLYLTDIRQFGRLWLLPAERVEPMLRNLKLGPEPLDGAFDLEELRRRLARRPRARLKELLLDQRFLAGLGNIYADETLFASGLHPLRTVESLRERDEEQLYRAIGEVLEAALALGGAKIRQGKAVPGYDFPRVHGRRGLPCPRCGATIEKTVVAGRGTYLCPSCQPEPKC